MQFFDIHKCGLVFSPRFKPWARSEFRRQTLLLINLLILLISSCQEPIKEFNIDSDVEHRTVKLYPDSTFKEISEEAKNTYEYTGSWKGRLDEGEVFLTTSEMEGYNVLTNTSTRVYLIKNGQAVDITNLKHVFYFHGKIIEQQGKEAVSPEFGRYEFDSIVSTLENQGWKVYADIRPQDVNLEEYCQKVSRQVDSLVEKVKCQPENIAIIGASKGAVMAMRVSDLNQYPINYVLLGANSDYIEENYDWYMKGRILGIYEKSDTIADKDYQFWINRSKEAKEFNQLEINTGLNHGFIFWPLKEWVEPTVEWINNN